MGEIQLGITEEYHMKSHLEFANKACQRLDKHVETCTKCATFGPNTCA